MKSFNLLTICERRNDVDVIFPYLMLESHHNIRSNKNELIASVDIREYELQ
jgi:hypothetical protein